MKRTAPLLYVILALAVSTGCTLQNVQPAHIPPPGPAPYPQPSGPYVVLERPDTVYYLIDYEIYFVPDIRDAVFFVEGAWYLHYGDRWYRGRSYSGPWVHVKRGNLPRKLDRLPRDYRSKRYRKKRVPYGHWDRERERPRPRPPEVRISRPEQLYLLISYGVYYVPDDRHEIFYADGGWYTRHRDVWYTGDSYRGPWSQADSRRLPDGLRKLPGDYRNRSYKAKRVPYGHWDDRKGRGDKRDRVEDVPPDSRQPDRKPRRDREPETGELPPPGAKVQPPPKTWGETKTERQPEKKKRHKGKDDKAARPEVLRYVEKLDIYYIPGNAGEILYYRSAWYMRDKNRWFVSDSYNGPWSPLDQRKKVPKRLATLPDNYRSDKYPSQEVPYGHWEDRGKRNKGER